MVFHNKGNFLEYQYESLRHVMLINRVGRNSHLALPETYSCRIMVFLFLKRTVPDPEPDVPEEELKHARDLWTAAVNADPLAVAVDMTNITACVESKARFTQLQYKADQYVEIEVFIRYCITDSIIECMF